MEKTLCLKNEPESIDTSGYSTALHRQFIGDKDFYKFVNEYEAHYLFDYVIETNFDYTLIKSESPDWIDIKKRLGIEVTSGDTQKSILNQIHLLKQDKVSDHVYDMYGDILKNTDKKFRKLNKNYQICDLNVLFIKTSQTDYNYGAKHEQRMFKGFKKIRKNYVDCFDYIILYSLINYIYKENTLESKFHVVYLFDFKKDCVTSLELKEQHYMSLMQKAVVEYSRIKKV